MIAVSKNIIDVFICFCSRTWTRLHTQGRLHTHCAWSCGLQIMTIVQCSKLHILDENCKVSKPYKISAYLKERKRVWHSVPAAGS